MTTRQLYTSVLLTSLIISLAAPLSAQQSWTSPEEFRTKYIQFVDTLAARVPPTDQSSWAAGIRQRILDLRQQVNTLPYPALNHFATSYDRQAFIKLVEGLTVGNRSFQENAEVGASLSFIRPRGVISAPNLSGAVAGTTCSANVTSAVTLDNEMTNLGQLEVAQVVLDYACDTIVVAFGEGTNALACAPAGIAKAGVGILTSMIQHQTFCNGVIRDAKIDAILADVTDIHGDLDALATALTNFNTQITAEFVALTNQVNANTNQLLAAGIQSTQEIVRFTTATAIFNPASMSLSCSNKWSPTLTLSMPAPAGGLLINLTSSSAFVTVPQTLIIADGTNSVNVPVLCVAPASSLPVSATITASALPFVQATTASVVFH